MSGFKEPGFSDRQKAALQAKRHLLDKFRAQPGPDDPDVSKRRAEREAIAARREQVRLARETEKAEQKRREDEAAAAEAARIARAGRGSRTTGRGRSRAKGQARCALCRAQGQRQAQIAGDAPLKPRVSCRLACPVVKG